MLTITDLKQGVFFELDGIPHQVITSEHFKLGRGGGIMRTKIKNLLSGAIFDRTFKGNDQFEEADVSKVAGQFLYADSSIAYFMNLEDFEQYSLKLSFIESIRAYLKEELNVELIVYDHQLIAVNIPPKVDLRVTYAEPGIKGDTATAATKAVTLETGLKVQVPLFINQGDIVQVDTRTGQYEKRVG